MGAFLLVTLMTVLLTGGAIVLFGRVRRAARDGSDGLASSVDTKRYLAQNWTMVEETARASGMSEDEIARVRANVLGLGE